MDKITHPNPRVIVVGGNFPCPDCKAETPHVYLGFGDPTWKLQWLGKEGEWDTGVGRMVKCVVCDAMWAHHVPFKGYPGRPEQMSRIVIPKKTE